VVEDVVEIVLNLKKVRIKLLNKKSEKVRLEFKGSGEFTAGMLQMNNNNFEVLNPDLHIATLNDEADLALEISIQRGRGYVPADENRQPDQPIGTIPLDAIYNPILNVAYKVENTRVGQRVDYEKLTLEITTDGSITPDEALTYSSKLLRDHIQLFIDFDIKSESEDEEEIDEEILRIRKLLMKPVEELELSVRSSNCLKEAKIRTISDLVSREEQDMLKFKNFGRKSLQELTDLLQEKGLNWGMDIEKYLAPQRKRAIE
jgi:DNA-directed RNA polymerase subunit alpha